MDPPVELVSFVTRAENRVTVLRSLASGPQTRRDLQDSTGIPRATLSRILADFRDRDVTVREGHEYRTTRLGAVLADELQSLFDAVAAMGTLQTLQEWLAIDELDVPIERLADAEVTLPSPVDPLAPIRRAESLLAEATAVRLAAGGIVPGCLDAIWRPVTEGRQTLEAIATQGALEAVVTDPEMRRQAQDLVDADAATLLVHPDELLPFLIVVDEVVWIAVADDNGTIQGHVETTDPDVRAWAAATIDRYVEEAEPVPVEGLTA